MLHFIPHIRDLQYSTVNLVARVTASLPTLKCTRGPNKELLIMQLLLEIIL